MSNLGGVVSGVGSVIGSVAGAGRSTFDLTKAIVNTQLRSDNEYRNLIGSVQAPRSILNNRISRNRRFATQQYQLDRLKGIARDQDATLNDVALAICGGSLRRFLDELGKLPRQAIDRDVAGQRAAQGRRGRGQRRRRNPGDAGHRYRRSDRASAGSHRDHPDGKGRAGPLMDKDAILAYTGALMAPFALQLASTISGVKTPLAVHLQPLGEQRARTSGCALPTG